MRVGERDREGARERDTGRDTHRERERERERQKKIGSEKESDNVKNDGNRAFKKKEEHHENYSTVYCKIYSW